MALLPPPDIGAAYVDEANRPTKDFYNWIRSLYDYARGITTGGGGGTPGGSIAQVQYNAGAGNFGGYTNSQVTSLLDPFTTTLKGVVPPSISATGTKFLRDDSLWAVPPGTGGGGAVRVQRSITGGPVTLVGTDEILNINIASPTSISLPAAATRVGKALTFKDVGSQAFANHITLMPSGGETIDGMATFVMTNDRQAITLNPFNDGVNTGWFLT